MNEHPIIGIYSPNQEACVVYYDPVSNEVYYEDEMGNTYLLTGFDVTVAADNSGLFSEFEETLTSTAENIIGVVKSGEYVWLLRNDNRCFKVPSGTLQVSAAVESAEYEDDMEYEPEAGEDE